jgi:hypothetical protein
VSPPSYLEYRAARGRWNEHKKVAEILPDHTYPRKAQDSDTCLDFLMRYGEPPRGFFARLRWVVKASVSRG